VTDEPLRILVADSHPVFRHGLCALLDSAGGLSVAGVSTTAGEATEAALALLPDVVVLDLPDDSQARTTARILAGAPRTAVLVLTMREDDDAVLAAIRAGARGYLLKTAGPAEVVRAIRVVHDGEAIFSPAIAGRLAHYFSAIAPHAAMLAFPQLTARERDVLVLIAAGRNNTEIARQLGVSPKTIRNRISMIFAKLQVADRSQAIVRAHRAGLGPAVRDRHGRGLGPALATAHG
jgi:DNA-binding NarL/FixJ family response regulator